MSDGIMRQDMAFFPPGRAAALGRWRAGAEPALGATALLFVLMTVPVALLMAADARLVPGALPAVSVWVKPMKFAVSLAVHLATLSLLWPFLNASTRDGWLGRAMMRTLVATCLFEFVCIASQAAAGQDSHFNLSTPYSRMVFSAMGVAAVILVVMTLAAGISVLRGTGPGHPALRRAVGAGLALSGALGLVTGGVIGAYGGHSVGIPLDPGQVDPGRVVPLFGWSRLVGDLRISHFIGLHAAQILPLVGWVAVARTPQKATAIVSTAAIVLTALSLGTLALALSGRPLF